MLIKIRSFLFQSYFRISRPMTLGVRIIAINDNNQICLVKHTYINGWHLPGGGIERGETAIEAAQKEIFEEAGLIVDANDLELLSIHANFESFSGDHVLLFRAKSWTEGHTHRPHEIAECKFFDLDKLPEGTTKGTIRRIKEALGDKISQNW